MINIKTQLWYKVLRECRNIAVTLYYGFQNIVTIIDDHFADLSLGIKTDGEGDSCPLSDDSSGKDMNAYSPTSYHIIRKILAYLKPDHEDTFIDIGCGKGRAVFLAAQLPLKKVMGIELDKHHTSDALKNLKHLKSKRSPVEILYADASKADIKDGTIYFLSNPFGESTVTCILKNIMESLQVNDRKIRIAYYNPLFRHAFDAQAWLSPDVEKIKDVLFWTHRYEEKNPCDL